MPSRSPHLAGYASSTGRRVDSTNTKHFDVWLVATGVFLAVLVAQLVLVALVGTDIPLFDQWDSEGKSLYPSWLDGTWRVADLLRAHNEHRILWTRLLDLGLFVANGQWDPLVQMAAGAFIHAAAAAFLAVLLAAGWRPAVQGAIAAGIALINVPHIAWSNALCGFQSQFYFAILFSFIALWWLTPGRASGWRIAGGIFAAVAACFSMGAGAFIPLALICLAILRAVERRAFDRQLLRDIAPGLGLLVFAWMVRAPVSSHVAFQAESWASFISAFARSAAWPHVWMPIAALVLNGPLLLGIGRRLAARCSNSDIREDFVLLLGLWALIAAAAMAWSRGGGPEFDGAVPPRYYDFLILLPVANVWCAIRSYREVSTARRGVAKSLLVGWGLFLATGWLGLSADALRGVIIPRAKDRDAPVRLAIAFQRTRDPAVFAGRSILLIPHTSAESVDAVLSDRRLTGKLPPSFQPGEPLGPLSRAVRWLLRRR
jgi:hypothetical protein